MILVFYSTLFTSMLSVSVARSPIQRLGDVARLRTHQVCVEDQTYAKVRLSKDVSKILFFGTCYSYK